MKKILLMLLAVMFSVAMLADDIIITKDSQRINAKIEEVGVDVVKYRRTDNLTGSLYSIPKAEIASIIYENGTVEAFQVQAPATTTQTNSPTTQKEYLIYSGGRIYTKDYKYLGGFPKGNNCPEAINLYNHGSRLENASTWMYTIGAVVGGAGILGMIIGAVDDTMGYEYFVTNCIMTSVGSTFVLIGIPLTCAGRAKQRRSVDIYNANCAPALTLNFTAGQNGVGLALNF